MGYQTPIYYGHIATGQQMGSLVLKGLNVVQRLSVSGKVGLTEMTHYKNYKK